MTMISQNPQFVVGLDRVGFAQIGAGLNSSSAGLHDMPSGALDFERQSLSHYLEHPVGGTTMVGIFASL